MAVQRRLLFLLLCTLWQLRSNSATQPFGVHVVRSPESAVAPDGDEVVFECELNLSPERLDWRFRRSNSQNFNHIKTKDGFNVTQDDRISKLRIFVNYDTLGEYQCVAWFGSAAIASTSARLTLASINSGPITAAATTGAGGSNRNTVRWNVAPKNCVLIRCGNVLSNPPAIWSFFRNGVKVPHTELVATSESALILNAVSPIDSGNYTCSAMNAITGVEVKLPNRIDLRVDYSERTPPHFLMQPATAVTARPGESVVLECPGVGSPPPAPVWSRPNSMNIFNNRSKTLPYGLQIADVRPDDQGTYVCRLDNGIAPALVHTIKFNVLEKPKIQRGPTTTMTNEGDELILECIALGNPTPTLYWFINGEDVALDNATVQENGRLIIKRVEKRHAGFVQCFAKNGVGEASEGNFLQVTPKQIQGEGSTAPLGSMPTRLSFDHSGNKNKGKRKHMKNTNMTPPSRPNVTRLSDDSVMLRWYVPKNDGLPIQFFKVQYRQMGDGRKLQRENWQTTGEDGRKLPRESWQTTSEDIPFGKRDRSSDGMKNFTSSVSGLKPDCSYRFRIVAVYSNNDNKEGSTSVKFFLQRGHGKSSLPVPELKRVEAISETEIRLLWSLPVNDSDAVDGFYAYYRPASSAGEYTKSTIDGMQMRLFKFDVLEPDTAYEFKLQSFNALAASEFSSILQGKTRKLMPPRTTTTPSVVTTAKANENENSIYPVVAGASGGGMLLLLVTFGMCLCMRKRKTAMPSDENKPQMNHIQADFVASSVIPIHGHHKNSHRANGALPRMNITPNPLAQEGEKNHNVMELRFMAAKSDGGHNGAHVTPNGLAAVDSETSQLQEDYQRSMSSCETLDANDLAAANPASEQPPPPPAQPSEIVLTSGERRAVNCTTSNTTATATATTTATSTNTIAQASQANHINQLPETLTNKAVQMNALQPANAPSKGRTVNLGTAAATAGSHQSLQHMQQPYHQKKPLGTPNMLPKYGVEYHNANAQPPPVPPHQNLNNHHSHHHHHQHQQHNHHHHVGHQSPPYQQTASPSFISAVEQNRRADNVGAGVAVLTARNACGGQMVDDPSSAIIASLRTRRSPGSVNMGNNGGVGIPIVLGNACIQRSPMPARAIIKRNRLASLNDNISSGSLNSIEV